MKAISYFQCEVSWNWNFNLNLKKFLLTQREVKSEKKTNYKITEGEKIFLM